MADIPRIRTLPQAIKEIQRLDGETCYSLRALRRSVNNGEIPAIHINSKVLINLDTLLDILANPKEPPAPGEQYGEIRRINSQRGAR